MEYKEPNEENDSDSVDFLPAAVAILNGDMVENENEEDANNVHNIDASTNIDNSTRQNISHKLPLRKFPKRTGTSDSGKEYEQMMCALYALKLTTDSNVEDFEMTSNNAEHGDFDDIGFQVRFKGNTTKTFLFQMKHKSNHKGLKVAAFENENNDFYASKYFDSISKTRIDDEICFILYTNASTYIKNTTNLSDGTVLEICDQLEHETLLMNDNKRYSNSILKFTKGDHKFYLLTQQNNLKEVKARVKERLQELFESDIYVSFVHYIKQWWSDNYVLCREDFVSKLSELALSPYSSPLSSKNCNIKTEYLKQAIMSFSITIITKDDGFITSIWNENFSEDFVKEIRKKLKLERHETMKTMWHLSKLPFVIRIDDSNKTTIKCALKLLKTCAVKKYVVLLGDVKSEEFEEFNVFRNLYDLLKCCENQDIYTNLVCNFRVSLQGRSGISLEQLLEIDIDIAKIVTTNELLEMSQKEEFVIGEKMEPLTEFHIPRTASVSLYRIKELLGFFKKTEDYMIIVNCDESFRGKNCKFVETMELLQYLKISNRSNDKKTKNILLSTNSKCKQVEFRETCEKSNKPHVYLFQEFDNEYCILQMQKGAFLPLRSVQKFIKEENLFGTLNNLLNIVCAPPGMGKSRLMKILSITCPPEYWTVRINSIKYNLFLKSNPSFEDIESCFLKSENTSEHCFNKQIRDILYRNRKVLFLLDGLDEVSSKYVDNVLEFVEYLWLKDVNIWVASRENLRGRISEKVGLVQIEILELNKKQQENYIRTRLDGEYNPEEVDKIIKAVFSNVDLNNSQMLLGIPLQLHMITEMFLKERNTYESLHQKNIFVLTHMYKIFFEGKLKSTWDKVVMDGNDEQLGELYFLLQRYHIPALKTCLNESDFKKLKLGLTDTKHFLNYIKTYGDKYGIIRTVGDDGDAIFEHQTYAEYFACVWLNNNKDKSKLLRDTIFSDRYENLRLMLNVMMAENNPLHLVFIYKNVNLIKKYIDDFDSKSTVDGLLLRLACTIGNKFDSLFVLHEVNRNRKREPKWYSDLMKFIIHDDSEILEKDELFDCDCIDYALGSHCLYPIEIFLQKKLILFVDIKERVSRFRDLKDLAFYTTRLGYLNLLSGLIEMDLKIVNKWGSELLWTAMRGCKGDTRLKTREGNIAVVRLLLENGVNVNEIFKKCTILDMAITEHYNDMIQILTEYGGKCTNGNTVLHRLVDANCPNEQFKIYVDSGIDMNARNAKGETVFHLACKKPNFENIKTLVEKGGININSLDNHQNTFLHHALRSKPINKKTVNFLIENGVNVNAVNNSERTAIQIACKSKNAEIVEILLKRSADGNVVDKEGDNLIMCELKSKKPNREIIKTLLEFGLQADIKYEMTAFCLACQKANSELVEKLLLKWCSKTIDKQAYYKLLLELQSFLQHNREFDGSIRIANIPLTSKCENIKIFENSSLREAVINLVDSEGNNLLMHALKLIGDDEETIDFLINLGFDVNIKNKYGTTALHLACRRGNISIIQKLLDKGADANVVDNKGQDLLMYSLQAFDNNEEVIDFLKSF